MSRPQAERVTCHACGHQQDFICWTSLNVTLDPELKSELLRGELTTFRCGRCGVEARVVYRLLYHDMDRSVLIWLTPPDGDGYFGVDSLAGAVWDIVPMGGQTPIRRFVPMIYDLIDKIRVFDDEWDDLAIELLKVIFCSRNRIPDEQPLYYVRKEVSPSGDGVVVFALPDRQANMTEVRMPYKALLDKLRGPLNAIRDMPQFAPTNWLCLDRHCVRDVLDEVGLAKWVAKGCL